MINAMVFPNMADYEKARNAFSWSHFLNELEHPDHSHSLNLAWAAIDRHAEGKRASHTALRWVKKNGEAENYSYWDLKILTSRFANMLEILRIQKEEKVFSLLGRVPELYITALGTLKKNAVFCPLFSVFGPEPVFQRLLKGEASVVVTTTDLYRKKIESSISQLPYLKYVLLIDANEDISKKVLSFPNLMNEASDDFTIGYTNPESPALLHFTSGTTGMPKGALHVHRAALMHYVTGKLVLDFHDDDVFWCTADPGWVTGTSYGILAPLINGITNITDEEEFDAERWYTILEKYKVNVWYTAPTAIRRLMRMDINPLKAYDLSQLRLIGSVGEPLHAEAIYWSEKTLGLPIYDNWWQTETGGIMISNYPSMKIKPGSMGKPLPGIEAAIAEVTDNEIRILHEPGKAGSLVIKKGWPSMFKTYLHEEPRYQKCFRNEWYITGDRARCDENGYYWFCGREDDVIKTSGHMVGPFEVESALMDHTDVAEAAVIGKPDPVIGEMVKAFIILKPGIIPNDETRQRILAFVRTKSGAALAPKEIEFVSSIPKTKSGKILRRLLKSRELGLPEGDLSTLEKT